MDNNKVIESSKLNTISLVLIFLMLCGCFGHATSDIFYKAIAILLFLISTIRLLVDAKEKNLDKYKISFQYFQWYFVFILFNCLSVKWSINVSFSIDLIGGMGLTLFLIYPILIYATSQQKIVSVIKALLLAYLYMCFRLIFFETGIPGTLEYGGVVGLHFNRIANALAYGILLSFYLYKVEKNPKYLFSIPVFYYIIFLTGSRKGLLMPITFLCVFLFLNMGINIKKMIRNVILVILLLCSLFMVINSNDTLKKRVEDLYNSVINQEETKDRSIRERNFFRKTALQLFNENPIYGIGANGFRSYLIKTGYTGTISYSHCNYTELLSTLGIIGTFLYYGMYIYIIKVAFSNFNTNSLYKLLALSFIVVQTIFEYGIVSYYMFEIQILVAIIFLNHQLSEKFKEVKQ